MTSFNPSQAAERYLENLAAELDVPPSRYEEATDRYKSVGAWLDREGSTLKDYAPDVYVQGSFRLGTPIRPINEDEHYDIDLVCELQVGKSAVTQQQLKALLGQEMKLYAKQHGMSEPSEGRRCWTLEYAEGAQFHLDALPAIPDATRQRLLLEQSSLSTDWVETSIAITDIDHPNYRRSAEDWPHSNPRGFTLWFRSRMAEAFERLRESMALEARASVEEVPSYSVKTPLQQAVQLLKRHRDIMFAADPENKPISVIITTLAGLSYANESNVAHALANILTRMDQHIKIRNGVTWIENPADPRENFADRWQSEPQRKVRFYAWLAEARKTWGKLMEQGGRERLVETATAAVGERVARSASSTSVSPSNGVVAAFRRVASAFGAAHKKPAPWVTIAGGTASIDDAIIMRNGFRNRRFVSNGAPLPKNATLEFKVKTDIPRPFEAYWQIVNTGEEAAAVSGGLRGGFDVGTVDRGSIYRREGTAYSGAHTVECLIVKNGYLVARSGAFIVNIE
uniref:nucleotide-binding domain-containing protein n=1 Tax=unclassified Variovorax TaxID=663243 RepID=UPI0010472AD6